jgi:hypothetical protein
MDVSADTCRRYFIDPPLTTATTLVTAAIRVCFAAVLMGVMCVCARVRLNVYTSSYEYYWSLFLHSSFRLRKVGVFPSICHLVVGCPLCTLAFSSSEGMVEALLLCLDKLFMSGVRVAKNG